MTEPNGASRRALLLGAGGATLGGAMLGLGADRAQATPLPGRGGPRSLPSLRPEYHLSVPDNWKNDPQRPIFVNGEYLYYYLYNADYLAGGGGTAWRLATTRDHVAFRDRGVAIPKNTNANGDCWSGSLVVDTRGTAGYGKVRWSPWSPRHPRAGRRSTCGTPRTADARSGPAAPLPCCRTPASTTSAIRR